MASAINDEDLDSEIQEPQPGKLGRRRSSVGTTNIISEADKNEAEALARKGAAQQRQKLWTVVICGAVLIAFLAVLTLVAVKTLLAPEPEVPFTKVPPRTIMSRPGLDTIVTLQGLNTSSGVLTANSSDAKLDASEYAMLTSDPDFQSGPLPYSATDENMFCGTEDCKNLASFLNNFLSPTRDTCESLYDQVCSRWARSHRRLAETRGRYSVDEAVLDSYRQQASRLLLNPSTTLGDQLTFYADCVSGRLLTEQDTEVIAKDSMPPDEGWTPETFANAVARMARIGVSPFFGISVEVSNHLFNVKLRLLDPIREYRVNDKNIGRNGASPEEKNVSPNNTGNVNESDKTAFFSALERFICQEITQMPGFNKSCVATADLSSQAPWWYEWYTVTGPKLLAQSVATMFEDLPVYSKALEEKIGMRNFFRVTPTSEQERSTRCLKFIDQRDPTLIPDLITAYVGPRYHYAVQKTLTLLKATLDSNLPNASAIGIAFLVPGVPSDTLSRKKHSRDLYGRNTASNASRLRRFLASSTWKRWTRTVTSESPSLSTTPTLSRGRPLVHIPLGVFNLTTASDKWLRALSLARVGPRILRSLFSLRHLSDELNKTSFSRCVSKLGKFVHRDGGSHVPLHGNGTHSSSGLNSNHRDIGPNLDLKEMASFFLSLQTYRALVGNAVAVAGTQLDSDSLFLLYYVFDNCQVEAASEATKSRLRPRYVRVWRSRRSPEDSTDLRRRRVNSVAAMFGGLLLEKCKDIVDLSNCETESASQFWSV